MSPIYRFITFSTKYFGKRTILLMVVYLTSMALSQAQNYVLVFSDEFEGTAVNTANWTLLTGDGTDFGLPPGWGNNELQFYKEENATVSGGFLTITAREELESGYNYTSSRMITENKQDFKYGRMEMRAKLPIGQGIWPAFWMFFTAPGAYGGWAASGEIDIMEYIGSEPDNVFGTIHFGQPFPGNVFSSRDFSPGFSLPAGNFNDDFHIFAIEWEPGEIRWFVDDILYGTQNIWWSNGGPYPAPFDQDFHLLLNLAVGGNLPGNPDATTVFPQEYIIDYVRVYEDTELPAVSLTGPADNTAIAPGSNITITADATAALGVAQVEFFQGELSLGTDDTAPYEITVSNVSEGAYKIRAVVTDNVGKFNYSDFVNITAGTTTQGPYAMSPTVLPGIIEVENFDVGGQGEAYNDTDPNLNEGSKSSGGIYRTDEGPDLEPTSDTGGGQNLAFTVNGEWLEYTLDVPQPGSYDIIARVAAQSSGGSFRLEFDGVDKTGPISFSATGGSQTWVNVVKENVQLDAGIQVMRLQILANGFNINKLSILPADPASGTKVTFDDMEHGDPSGNGWFTFNGSGGGGIDANFTDLPPQNGGSASLQTGWGSGGTPGFFGGFGRNSAVDISETTYFNFWINPDAGQDYTLEINLQDDDNNDGTRDDEFQYNFNVSATGPDALSGGGWQLASVPLSDFVDDNSVLTGGNGILDGDILTVVLAVISNSGADVSFRTDFWSFTKGPLGPEINVSPSVHNFGQVPLTSNGAQVFTVTNQGCSDLEVTATGFAGADAGDFSILSGAAPFTLTPGAEQTVLVSFNPSSLGPKMAELTIESTDSDEPVSTITLTGEGVEAPDILKVIFDDMEHGDPLANGYFTFNGLSGANLGATSSDLPPTNSGAFSLETSWSSGGAPGFFGGFGRTFPVDLSSMTHFNFWINPDADQDYIIEIQLQDDDNGDDMIPFPPEGNDDEFQVNFAVNANGDAISGGGWQLISIPLNNFFDDNSLQNGGNGIFDPIATSNGGNGQLVNVIFGFISNSGADVSFRTDFWCFSQGPLGVTDPEIAVDPDSKNFGLQSPGTSTSQLFTVSNLGGADLNITNVSIVGPDAAEFNIDAGGDPITIGVAGTSDIVVSFNPASFGLKSATLNIESNDPDQNPLLVALTGEGSELNKVIFDDMEHGDPFGNGWFTFNGNGGGGIDPNSEDLPPSNGGAFSLQTGWGGGGAPGFYGGFGRTNPVDITSMTHFNFWINPNAGQDYTLEINLQDDDNNDNILDDEFQYNFIVSDTGPDAVSGGGWQLASIPLSDFFDDNSFLNGGNGVLDVDVINVVIAVISNSGADVNLRTDFWCFSEGPLRAKVAFDDMEHGDPFGNGWFTFNGNGGGGIDPNFEDLPPQNGGGASLQTGWGSGGNPGFFGGFGRTNPTHIADMTYFNLWINPDDGQDYVLEINLQEDDNGDGVFPFPAPNDDEFQFNLEVGPNGAHGVSGGGWQLISIPLSEFFDDNSIHGGNGIFDPVPAGSGGNGELISIVIAVISNSGADVTFRTDFWCFSDGPLEEADIVVDPLVFDFEDVTVGSSLSKSFTISNEGIANLWVSGSDLSGPDAGEFSIIDGIAPFAVPAGQSQEIVVSFNPASAAGLPKSGNLEIASNDPDQGLVTVNLTGKGVPPVPHDFLLLSRTDIDLDGLLSSEGHMHANDDIDIDDGNPTVYTGDLSAVDNIDIDNNNSILGDVTAGGALTLQGNASVSGSISENSTVNPVPLPDFSFTAGGNEVEVENNQTVDLLPGSYGEVEVSENGTLSLQTGDYYFEELELEKNARLNVDVSLGPVNINVEEEVEFGKSSQVEILPLAEHASLFVTIRSLGEVQLKDKVVFVGSILAPNEKVKLGKSVNFKGAICAGKIQIKENSVLTAHEPVELSTAQEATKARAGELTEEVPARNHRVLSEFKLYPNPSNGHVNILLSGSEANKEAKLQVVNNLGQLVFSQTIKTGALTPVDLTGLRQGIYFIRVVGGYGSNNQRIIIR